MTELSKKLYTYKDLEAFPEDMRVELEDGSLVVQPSPISDHSSSQGKIRRFIGGPFDDDDGYDGPGGWWILADIDVEFDNFNTKRPDLAGWRRDRLPDPHKLCPITIVPDWICEILSPSNASYDRKSKANLYAAHGVKHYWILDPEVCLLEIYELQAGKWMQLGVYDRADKQVRLVPFDAIVVNVDRFFLPSRRI